MFTWKKITSLLSGLVIGGVMSYSAKDSTAEMLDEEFLKKKITKLDNISKQFEDKISSDLQIAEKKINNFSADETKYMNTDSELGLFL
jgi:division protein CdvB (Snf7/Vps24/ESCRT-III family)